MDLLDIDRSGGGEAHLGDYLQEPVANYVQQEPALSEIDTTAALELVSEAAAVFRSLEQETAQALSHAHDLAYSFRNKLELSEARAQRAEATIEELSEAVAQAREELQMLRNQLSAKEAQFVAMEERAQRAEKRADGAEQRASEANLSIGRILEAIRSQLPARQQ
ncbi:MAG: ABC transporter permease [Methylocystis sp.]|jgi:uncharacterized coiled-coil protein SlyX